MDTTLDNNPFANSNGAPSDNNILPQKSDGLLLNLQDNFKPNGGSDMNFTTQEDFFANLHENLEKANGKRATSSEHDDELELGPETDIDAVDDVLMSPAIAASKALTDQITNNNPLGIFGEGGLSELEMHMNQLKQQGMEFDGERSPREETPTPPADAVHDVGGLVENVADSGEESEDEWNYFKGEQADKENIQPQQSDKEIADQLDSEADNMSQLNPNAAEFVPVSPTRSVPSPIRKGLEDIISQSPVRPAQSENNDIAVPNQLDFENEVKIRPGEIEENGKLDDDDSREEELNMSSNEMSKLLSNGVTHDDAAVDANITSTPTKQSLNEEFHFGPNAAPFTPAKLLDQSEAALSTKAVYGDESAATLGESTLSVDNNDPMSTSFYQDREDDTNPFDLDRVQVLPENLESFLNKPVDNSMNDTLSDLPEHNPLEFNQKPIDNNMFNNDEKIITTDLDKNTEEEKELASPLSQEEDLLGGNVCEMPKQENIQDLLSELAILSPQPASSPSPQPKLSPEPVPLSPSPQPEPVALSPSPQPEPVALSPSPQPEPVATSPEPNLQPPAHSPALSPSPEIGTCPGTEWTTIEQAISPEPTGDICRLPGAVEKVLSPEPVEEQQEILECSLPVDVTKQFLTSSDRLIDDKMDEKLDIEEAVKDEELKKEVLDDVTSSVKDDSSSPLSPVDKIIEDSFVALSESTLKPDDIVKDLSSPEQVIPQDSFKSVTDTESVATSDVNSFLNRSDIPEVESPLSPSNKLPSFDDDISDPNHPLRRCVFPLPTQDLEITTEQINQQFAEPAIVTPSEESKQDVTPTAPLIEEKQESTGIQEVAALTAVAAGVAAVATTSAVEKKTSPKSKIIGTKKPPTKPSTASPTKTPAKSPLTAKAPPSTTRLVASKSTTVAAKTTKSTTSVPKSSLSKPTTLKPKTTTTSATTKTVSDKKPLANGDVKPAVRSTLTSRKPADSLTKPATTARSSTLKSTTTSSRATPLAPKPSTARPSTATAPPKPRLPPFSARTTTTKTSTTALKPPLSKVAANSTSPKTSAAPKPRPTTAPKLPRVPLTKTITKGPDAEKQIKESANKLTASRTTTTSRTVGSATARTTTVRKTETKATAPRTTLTKTTTTTLKSSAAGKKPTEITRTVSKTKTSKTEAPKLNGVSSTVVTEKVTIENTLNENISEPSELVKDNSPVDNKLLIDNNSLIQPLTAD